jgi:uncharacterized protein (TIGR03118 family)
MKIMKFVGRSLISASFIAICVIAGTAARADDNEDRDNRSNRYMVTNLTADLPGVAPNTDPVLRNAWGVAFTPAASPFWIADNASGCSTLYDGTGMKVALQVAIPLSDNTVPSTACQPASTQTNPPLPTPAAPTGIVWNPTTSPTTGFVVPGTNIPASFIFDTEDGSLSAWAGAIPDPSRAVVAVDNSGSSAVYKGLATGVNVRGVFLFATNFNAGTIDVFAPNGSAGFRAATKQEIEGDFSDPSIPGGFAPFGIQNINGDLFVTYAKQNTAKHDDVAGPGNGFVDVFDTNGHLLQRFASRGPLNSPWGVARASFAFGPFSGQILIGNFGNGKINVFDSDGNFLGTLRGDKGRPIVIDGLWTLTLGGGRNSSSNTLYFTAGPNDETNGLFGTITPAAKPHSTFR